MKKNLWLILGLSVTTNLLAQQLTNPPPATVAPSNVQPPAAAIAAEPVKAATNTPAKPKAAAKKAAKKTVKKQSAKTAAAKADAAASLRTTPLVPGTATVVANNVNVRGQAKLRSEVVAHVTKGQELTVLEELMNKNSAEDEPSAWAKVLLPTNTVVWVSSQYLSNNTVAPKQLNVRSGPGENYSVLGRIARGTTVTPLTTKEGWTQIQAPADAYGFIAAQFLKQEAAPVIALASPKQSDTATAMEPAKEQAAAPAVPEAPATPEKVTEAPTVAPAPSEVPAAPHSAETAAAPAPAPVPAPAISATDTNAPAEQPLDEPPPKRIVQREGIVRGTVSIQAPSHYGLVSTDTGKLINYLYTTSPSLDLSRYKGLKVIVTGEEALEERWGNTPVITIQKLEPVDE